MFGCSYRSGSVGSAKKSKKCKLESAEEASTTATTPTPKKSKKKHKMKAEEVVQVKDEPTAVTPGEVRLMLSMLDKCTDTAATHSLTG